LTPRGIFLLFTGLLIFTVSLVFQKWALSLLSVPFLLPVLLAIHRRPVDPSLLQVRRELPSTSTFVRDSIQVGISVKNLSEHDVLLEVREAVPGNLRVSGIFPYVLLALKPHQEVRFNYTVTSNERGHFSIGPLEVWQLDPFLVTRRRVVVVPEDKVVFLPCLGRISYLELPHARTTHMAGETPSNSPGEGYEFIEVTEARGIAGKRINWKAFAKSRKIYVNMYRVEKSLECLVILDVPRSRLLGNELTSILVDRMVELTATLLFYLSKRGHRVSLLVIGSYRDWVKSGYGKRHMLRMLHALASVRSLEYEQHVDYSEVFQLTAPFLTKTGSLIFVISTFTEPSGNNVFREAVSRGYTVVPVPVNPFKTVENMCKGEKRKIVSRLGEIWEKGILDIMSSYKGLKVDFQLVRLVEAALGA